MSITRIIAQHIDMDTQPVTFGELTTLEQQIVSEARGWDGTHYHDHASGTVIELLAEDGSESKYRVVVKGDANVTGEVPAEAETAPEAPAAPATDAPVQETEPTAPEATDATVPTDAPTATDVQEPTTDTAPTDAPVETPASTDDTAPQGDQTPA